MSKKNNLAKREKQHEYNLQKEKELQDKKIKKLQANKNKMKLRVSVWYLSLVDFGVKRLMVVVRRRKVDSQLARRS
ncbi:PREDICTED: uncharacterized protein LOC106341122 isoform X2 [Brassica oleracea var. oleracea]|uniref:uncharacterized protein LOC106341122 isoform X2 n=1 Tax=Brassica oleracea var. oleracea TaxID=109376 RepID=UPI0006A6EDF2|nr:PREDICTED: uncharacterized protein LOC106341122 isoform X2 [Brassica oleracea var. oleracea]